MCFYQHLSYICDFKCDITGVSWPEKVISHSHYWAFQTICDLCQFSMDFASDFQAVKLSSCSENTVIKSQIGLIN